MRNLLLLLLLCHLSLQCCFVLFQLLKYFEGPMTLVGTVVIPTVAVGFLAVLPFLDRKGAEGRRRPPVRLLVPFFGIFLGAGLLTAASLQYDANSASYRAGREEAIAQACALLAEGLPDPTILKRTGAGQHLKGALADPFHVHSTGHVIDSGKNAPLLAGLHDQFHRLRAHILERPQRVDHLAVSHRKARIRGIHARRNDLKPHAAPHLFGIDRQLFGEDLYKLEYYYIYCDYLFYVPVY